MTCICKLKVDKLKEALGTLQNNVLGLPSLDLTLPALEDLAATAAASPKLDIPIPSLDLALPVPMAALSASETETMAAAASLAEAANLQASLQAQLGVNPHVSYSRMYARRSY